MNPPFCEPVGCGASEPCRQARSILCSLSLSHSFPLPFSSRHSFSLSRFDWVATILAVAVVVLFFETTIRFGFMSGFFRTHGLEVLNQDGKPVVFMGATPEGEGLIVLYDRVGFLRAAIVTTQLGDVAIKLFDGSGIQRVSIAVKVDGSVVMKGF